MTWLFPYLISFRLFCAFCLPFSWKFLRSVYILARSRRRRRRRRLRPSSYSCWISQCTHCSFAFAQTSNISFPVASKERSIYLPVRTHCIHWNLPNELLLGTVDCWCLPLKLNPMTELCCQNNILFSIFRYNWLPGTLHGLHGSGSGPLRRRTDQISFINATNKSHFHF